MSEKVKDALYEKKEIDEKESQFRNKVNAGCLVALVLLFSILLIVKMSDPVMLAAAEIVLSFAMINFEIQQSYHAKHRNLWLFLTVIPIALIVVSFVKILMSK